MGKKLTLDRIDRKILDVLRQDGRIAYKKLSELVNLTPRPCLERVKRLKRAGIIAGYTAVVNLPSTDHGHSQAAFEQELRSVDAVLDCWLVSGSFDFLVRIACRDMEQYRELAHTWLTSSKFKIDKIVTTTELQVIKRSQETTSVNRL